MLGLMIRGMAVVVGFGALYLLIFTPVANIDAVSCSRISARMSLQDVHQITGAPPGWYDGVGGILTDAPKLRSADYWVGLKGELVVLANGEGRVVSATFYPAKRILAWDGVSLVWERITRIRHLHVSAPQRIGWFVAFVCAGTGIVVAATGLKCYKYGCHYEGKIATIVGAIVAIPIFADLFIGDLYVMAFVLVGPFLAGITASSIRFMYDNTHSEIGGEYGAVPPKAPG